MRFSVTPIAALAVTLAAGCAEKSQQPAAANSTQASAAQSPRTGSPEAQAAARMTVDQLDAAMKSANAANESLGMRLSQGDLAAAAKDASAIASGFAEIERFFAQANKSDGVDFARRARKTASEVAAAATAGNARKASAERDTMNAACKQCHDTYREGDARTGYRLKAGAI